MKQYYITSPSCIANYLHRTITGFGFFVRMNRSDVSDSHYLNINTGSRENPNSIHVRISNHPVSRYNTSTHYDYDICGARARPGTITYIKFLAKFASQHDKPLPKGIQPLQPGTKKYKKYAISLQKRS